VTHVTEEVKSFIGMETDVGRCWDVVERGAVRRFAQAVMDLDPVFVDADFAAQTRFERPVAPPLYPLMENDRDTQETEYKFERVCDEEDDRRNQPLGCL